MKLGIAGVFAVVLVGCGGATFEASDGTEEDGLCTIDPIICATRQPALDSGTADTGIRFEDRASLQWPTLPECADVPAQAVTTCCNGAGGPTICNCVQADGGVQCVEAPAYCACAIGTVCRNQYPDADGVAYCK